MALVIRTEERDILSECIQLLDNWGGQLELDGEEYVPPDNCDTAEGKIYRAQLGSISRTVGTV
jgi:hypothetical protein